ncbi:hypothetical protein [Nocardioides sp.]|uniref:hypothetical protein n=1 Tax=Nocardioides sp. TaxID=35761 RepID=UPI00356928F2
MPSRRTPLLRAATVGLTALALALALAGTSASGATGDRTSSVAPPIPPSPSDARVEKFEGAAAKARPIKQRRLPQHPFLAPNGRSSMHNDAYSSDAYEVSGPLGRDLVVTSATYGIRECATITFDSQDRILALCGGLEGFVMMLIDPVTLDPIAELAMPGRDVTSGANPLTDICGGTYFFLTPDDHAIATTTESSIWEVRETATGLAKVGSWELAPHIPDGDCVVATAPDWKGRVWFFTQQGTVGTLNRRTGKVRTLRLGEARGEGIYNSVSADETGGVYVVTTHAMYRLDAGRTAQPRITWQRDYDRGSVQKPGMLSQGSGTSPTLLGRKWMAITDNADPRTHIVVYDRRKGVKRRLHCRIPVLPEGASTTENSLVAAGNSVIIENNYGYQNPGSTMFGRSTTPGIARVLIKKRGCKVAWTNTSTAPTSVPKGSLGNGLVYAYTKPPRSDGIDAWYLTAIDIRSGKTVWSRLTGTGTQWNNHYAAIYLGPDGTAYIATLSGLVRIQDGPA